MTETGKPKILVFGGPGKDSGEGPENLVISTRLTKSKFCELDADIVGFVSTRQGGGLEQRATRLAVPFIHMESPFTADAYSAVMHERNAEWAACSGWPRYVCGIDPARAFNIHPAPLRDWRDRMYGGQGMYGNAVHELVASEIAVGRERHIGICMHFLREAEGSQDPYYKGPVFFQCVELFGNEMEPTMENVRARVRRLEYLWQPRITNLVVHGDIRWDGKDPASLVVPAELLKAA
ncbi:hypothetical protein FJY94_05360 [Candidatus Kaiserbacteria bacterium]|nr:hypothetical protein [Candidatus Kaiserbacteria bacterium]